MTGATASGAVLFSGLAFALAMSGLLLVPDTILRSLGFGATQGFSALERSFGIGTADSS